jgi:hypothetical protein
MDLNLIRRWVTPESTIGELYIEGVWECFTLEDVIRPFGNKVQDKTAIWGDRTYRVIIDYSPKFKKDMPHVINVPFFSGIRIHSGNTADDSSGCILVGKTREKDKILESKVAFGELFPKLKTALDAGEPIFLSISNPLTAIEPT